MLQRHDIRAEDNDERNKHTMHRNRSILLIDKRNKQRTSHYIQLERCCNKPSGRMHGSIGERRIKRAKSDRAPDNPLNWRFFNMLQHRKHIFLSSDKNKKNRQHKEKTERSTPNPATSCKFHRAVEYKCEGKK